MKDAEWYWNGWTSKSDDMEYGMTNPPWVQWSDDMKWVSSNGTWHISLSVFQMKDPDIFCPQEDSAGDQQFALVNPVSYRSYNLLYRIDPNMFPQKDRIGCGVNHNIVILAFKFS